MTGVRIPYVFLLGHKWSRGKGDVVETLGCSVMFTLVLNEMLSVGYTGESYSSGEVQVA